MSAYKRRSACCSSEATSSCGQADTITPCDPSETESDFATRVLRILEDQQAVVSFEERGRFIDHLSRSLRQRKAVARLWSNNRRTNDIIGLIHLARDVGDMDDAIWRCFLAAHFGRASADADQAPSAARFLCAFGTEPYWTWQRVCDAPTTLRTWLANHDSDLQSLSFGNHRKYESKWPDDIWAVVESFLTLAEENDGPKQLVTVADHKGDAAAQFDVLYRRLSPLWRFGRTGRFDFLSLLIDLRLISAEPASCYLRGATGPLKGAKRLWGKRPIGEIDRLAANLAARLKVSPMAIEDALCNWQK